MAFNFSENETVDSIEKVPAELRGYYQAGEGGVFSIRADMKLAAGAWDGMAKATTTVRQQLKEAGKGKIDMSPLVEFGSTPQEIRDAVDGRIKEMSDVIEAKKGDVNPDKLRKQMTEGFEVKEKVYQERNQALQTQLYTHLVRDEAHKALSSEKGDPNLLMHLIEDTVKTVEENGTLVARVFEPGSDEPRLGNMGLPMTVTERVQELKRDDRFKVCFEADAKPGSNPPTQRVPGGMPREPVAKSSAQKITDGLATQAGGR